MIMIQDVLERTTRVQIEVTRDVETYDITTSDMDDSCIPYRVAQKAMMWISNDGLLAELECIYPQYVNGPLCFNASSLITLNGTPKIVCDKSVGQVWIEDRGSSFTVWFTKGEQITKEVIVAPNMKVLVTNSQVVGITAMTVS